MSFVGVVLHCLNEEGGKRHGRSINDPLASDNLSPPGKDPNDHSHIFSAQTNFSELQLHDASPNGQCRVIEFSQDN